MLFWPEITTPLPRVFVTDCETIQDSWQSLSVSLCFNHTSGVPPWVKLWKIRVPPQQNLGEKKSLETEGWILCCQHVAYSAWHSSVRRKPWVAWSLGMSSEAEWLRGGTWSKLVMLEILHLHLTSAPCGCPEEYFWVLVVGGSLEQWEIIASS